MAENMKKNICKVTVIMPVYNCEKYLREAIDSILNQTFNDFEFLIINDGSIDSSRKIILSYDDPRIRFIDNEKNIGITCSLNKGLQLAKGEYIARQDADDISFPERLEKQVVFLDTYENVGLVGSSPILIDADGNKIKMLKVRTDSKEIKESLFRTNQFIHGSVIFRNKCIEQIGSYREAVKFCEDYDLWLRISESWDVANIREPLYYLRINLNSISVVEKTGQERYALLARTLAEQRKNTKEDKLATLNTEQIRNILDDISPMDKEGEKKILADNYFSWSELFYLSGNYPEAKRWLLQSFKNKPESIRSYILFLKIIICAVLPPQIIKRLKVFLRGSVIRSEIQP